MERDVLGIFVVNWRQAVYRCMALIDCNILQEPSQRVEHPGLRPTHERRAHAIETPTLVVEEALWVAEVSDRPNRSLLGEGEGIVVQFAQIQKRNYTGGCCMRINWVEPVMVVFWPPIRKKEASPPELIATQ